MHRKTILLLAFILLLPLAVANYQTALVPPTCTTEDVYNAGWNGALSAVLPSTVLGGVVPIIKIKLGADETADNMNAPYLVGLSNAASTTTNYAADYWTSGAIHSSLISFGAFKLATDTLPASGNQEVDVTIDFTNQSITLANNTHFTLSDVSWYQPAVTLPTIGEVHIYTGGRNVTGSGSQFLVPLDGICTGGNTNFVVQGTVADRWYDEPGMAFLVSASTFQNPPLFARDGAVTGNLSQLSQALFGTPHAYDATLFWVGLLLIIAIGGGIASVAGMWGGIMGAFVGILFVGFINWWPVWLVVLTLAGIGGLSFLLAGRGNQA